MTGHLFVALLWTTISTAAPVPAGDYFAYSAKGPPFFSIDGFQINCRLELFRTDPEPKSYRFPLNGAIFELTFSRDLASVDIAKDGTKLLHVDLAKVLAGIENYRKVNPGTPAFEVPQAAMTLEASSSRAVARIYFYNVAGRKRASGASLDHIKSDVLLRLIADSPARRR